MTCLIDPFRQSSWGFIRDARQGHGSSTFRNIESPELRGKNVKINKDYQQTSKSNKKCYELINCEHYLRNNEIFPPNKREMKINKF